MTDNANHFHRTILLNLFAYKMPDVLDSNDHHIGYCFSLNFHSILLQQIQTVCEPAADNEHYLKERSQYIIAQRYGLEKHNCPNNLNQRSHNAGQQNSIQIPKTAKAPHNIV